LWQESKNIEYSIKTVYLNKKYYKERIDIVKEILEKSDYIL